MLYQSSRTSRTSNTSRLIEMNQRVFTLFMQIQLRPLETGVETIVWSVTEHVFMRNRLLEDYSEQEDAAKEFILEKLGGRGSD